MLASSSLDNAVLDAVKSVRLFNLHLRLRADAALGVSEGRVALTAQ